MTRLYDLLYARKPTPVVALSRAIAIDAVEPMLALINLAALLGFTIVGMLASVRTFRRKLTE